MQFNQNLLTAPRGRLLSTFDMDSELGKPIANAAFAAEHTFVRGLLDDLDQSGVRGDIVEFGVGPATNLERLCDWRAHSRIDRQVWGFDSFEGLPATTSADLDCWSQGMYAHSIESVSETLEAQNRPWLHLVKGWFDQTLRSPDILAIASIAYVRIDCDLHASAATCLKYLTSRLPDQSILVFDDWTYDPQKGETRAFLEWLPTVPHLSFETLLENPLGHVYFRVWNSA
jgi:Macrocin-O-methyltransferase (TylF)